MPFTHTIKNNIDKGTIDIEITDFSYSFKNEDELSVHIEYVITGDEDDRDGGRHDALVLDVRG